MLPPDEAEMLAWALQQWTDQPRLDRTVQSLKRHCSFPLLWSVNPVIASTMNLGTAELCELQCIANIPVARNGIYPYLWRLHSEEPRGSKLQNQTGGTSIQHQQKAAWLSIEEIPGAVLARSWLQIEPDKRDGWILRECVYNCWLHLCIHGFTDLCQSDVGCTYRHLILKTVTSPLRMCITAVNLQAAVPSTFFFIRDFIYLGNVSNAWSSAADSCHTRVRDKKLVDVVDYAVGSKHICFGDDGLAVEGHVSAIAAHFKHGALQGLQRGASHNRLRALNVLQNVVVQQVCTNARSCLCSYRLSKSLKIWRRSFIPIMM